MTQIEITGGVNRRIRRKWAKYRWEFMRRDPAYREDYTRVLEVRKLIRLPEHLEKQVKKTGIMIYLSEYNEEAEKERKLCAKYGFDVGCMPDPDKSYDDLAGTERHPKFLLLDPVMPSPIRISFAPEDVNKMIIEIDFDKVNSLPALKEEVSKLLEKRFKARGKGKQQKYMRDYDVILRVGDMKEKASLTDQEIAKKIDPRKFKKNPPSATRNVGHLYDSYKELVNGGYKKMSFP